MVPGELGAFGQVAQVVVEKTDISDESVGVTTQHLPMEVQNALMEIPTNKLCSVIVDHAQSLRGSQGHLT